MGTPEAAANMSFMAIAYHNQAVEQEFLGRRDDAKQSYQVAVKLADRCWGSTSPMAMALRNNLKGVLQRPPALALVCALLHSKDGAACGPDPTISLGVAQRRPPRP